MDENDLQQAFLISAQKFYRRSGFLGVGVSTIALIINLEIAIKLLFLRSPSFRIEDHPPFFMDFFYLLMTINMVCVILLMTSSFSFIFSRIKLCMTYWVAGTVPFVVLLLAGASWPSSRYGPSIAAASGVGLAGLAPIFLSMIAFWFPPALNRFTRVN